jgi:hypothetical protein
MPDIRPSTPLRQDAVRVPVVVRIRKQGWFSGDRKMNARHRMAVAMIGLVLGAAAGQVSCSNSIETTVSGVNEGGADASSEHDAGDIEDGSDGVLDAKVPIDGDAWCAPDGGSKLDLTSCCDDKPCYGTCFATPDGPICDCYGIAGGCPEGLRCCLYYKACALSCGAE